MGADLLISLLIYRHDAVATAIAHVAWMIGAQVREEVTGLGAKSAQRPDLRIVIAWCVAKSWLQLEQHVVPFVEINANRLPRANAADGRGSLPSTHCSQVHKARNWCFSGRGGLSERQEQEVRSSGLAYRRGAA